MRIALAGNPNSGKTTMYNALTGRNEHVGNWAGVTVEKKAYTIKKSFCTADEELIAVDLPGAYSMSPFTSEESITSSYVRNEHPDAIINIVDATNLSRSLFFTTQLLELGIPVVVALNKADVNKKKGTKINTGELAKLIGCPVIDTVSTSKEGLSDVVKTAYELNGKGQVAPYSEGDVDLNSKDEVIASDKARFEFVNSIVEKVEKRKVLTKTKNVQDKVDDILTNRWLGLPIFALIMSFVLWVSQYALGPLVADWLVGLIEIFQGWVGESLTNAGAAPILVTILADGIIGGVGAVVGFLPLVMVMYFLISLLEDCGYMARATVVLDPIFKKVGLNGKSVIPFVIGIGCSIPGVMACRTIRNERERRATAMLTPFMPCGAKLPVIALFAGVFFKNSAWIGISVYFIGIALILLGALLVNKLTAYKARPSFFIMELAEYKIPSLKRATLSMFQRAWAFIVKAGTIILVCNAVVQIMQMFNWKFELVAEGMEDTSILASIATPFAFVLIPLGFGIWQLAAAAVTGFIAKENVVGTLAVCFGLTELINEDFELVGSAGEVASTMGITAVAALAYLMFNLYTPPCFAAIGAMNAEIKSKKWVFGGIALQLATGYTIAFLVYQFGTLFTTGKLGTGFLPGLVVVLAIVVVIVYLCFRAEKNLKKEYQLNAKEA